MLLVQKKTTARNNDRYDVMCHETNERFELNFVQLALDFGFDSSPLDVFTRQDHINEQEAAVNEDVDAPESQDAKKDGSEELEFNNAKYIDFAISLLKLSANDLARALRVLESDVISDERRENAQFTVDSVTAWLKGFDDVPFTLKDCAELLEHELRISSYDNIRIPEIGKNWQVLGNWILSDPQRASAILSAYITIFAPGATPVEDKGDLEELMNDYADREMRRKGLRNSVRQRP